MGKRKEKKQAAREAKNAKKQRRGQQEQRPAAQVDMKHNPLYPERVESNAMGVLVAIISIVVAIILLVVIVTQFSYASANSRRHSQTDSYYNDAADDEEEEQEESDAVDGKEETAETEETGDSEEENEPDLSDIDIDAVSDGYAEFTGTLVETGAGYAVVLEGSYNIYAYDDSGEADVLRDVNQIFLNDIGDWDIASSVDGEVSIAGYLEISDKKMTMTLTKFEGSGEDDTAIHTYQIMIDDCTWSEAMQKAQEMGGYLVRINSQEEYDAILEQLNAGDYSKYHFYLGGRRDSDGTDYYWVDVDNQFIGECLNGSSSWCQSAWYDGEPSFADGDIAEDAMNLFCVGDTWYLNDSSMDLAGNYPDYLGGKVGYIVEIEE